MQDACLSVLLDRYPRLILCALGTTAPADYPVHVSTLFFPLFNAAD